MEMNTENESSLPIAVETNVDDDDGKTGSSSITGSSFTKKLFEILEDPRYGEILKWNEGGLTFEITSPKRLELEVLPIYFRHARFQSFVRQLNFYAFKKVTKERSSWVYSHDLFQRNKPELLEGLRRKTNSIGLLSVEDSPRSPAASTHANSLKRNRADSNDSASRMTNRLRKVNSRPVSDNRYFAALPCPPSFVPGFSIVPGSNHGTTYVDSIRQGRGQLRGWTPLPSHVGEDYSYVVAAYGGVMQQYYYEGAGSAQIASSPRESDNSNGAAVTDLPFVTSSHPDSWNVGRPCPPLLSHTTGMNSHYPGYFSYAVGPISPSGYHPGSDNYPSSVPGMMGSSRQESSSVAPGSGYLFPGHSTESFHSLGSFGPLIEAVSMSGHAKSSHYSHSQSQVDEASQSFSRRGDGQAGTSASSQSWGYTRFSTFPSAVFDDGKDYVLHATNGPTATSLPEFEVNDATKCLVAFCMRRNPWHQSQKLYLDIQELLSSCPSLAGEVDMYVEALLPRLHSDQPGPGSGLARRYDSQKASESGGSGGGRVMGPHAAVSESDYTTTQSNTSESDGKSESAGSADNDESSEDGGSGAVEGALTRSRSLAGGSGGQGRQAQAASDGSTGSSRGRGKAATEASAKTSEVYEVELLRTFMTFAASRMQAVCDMLLLLDAASESEAGHGSSKGRGGGGGDDSRIDISSDSNGSKAASESGTASTAHTMIKSIVSILHVPNERVSSSSTASFTSADSPASSSKGRLLATESPRGGNDEEEYMRPEGEESLADKSSKAEISSTDGASMCESGASSTDSDQESSEGISRAELLRFRVSLSSSTESWWSYTKMYI